MRRARSGC